MSVGFLTGLPRSRTAWWANLLTWGNSIWKHDALYDEEANPYLASLNLIEWLDREPYGLRGHSDSSNLLIWERLHDVFPKAKWVFVKRDIDDVLNGCRRFNPSMQSTDLFPMMRQLTAMRETVNPKIIDFGAVNVSTCYDVADYFGVDIGPEERVSMLCDMNIQIHPPILKKRLEQLKNLQAA